MSKIACDYAFDQRPNGAVRCRLGLYGGRGWLGNCQACQKAGENTPEFAAALFSRAGKAHPSDKKKISGCCDDARNPT